MARQDGKRSSQGMRNLRSAGWDAAKFTGRTTEKAAVGLARWATTDHSGMGKAFENMPSMGFIETIQYALMVIVFAMVGILAHVAGVMLTIGWCYLLVIYGIPFLLTGEF
ncbi:hypothetical protein MTYP_02760 [Methylophilaceae bacterium]|nr:hypothetical protein MTYP_02760 [Methylophilaceae bacterium]